VYICCYRAVGGAVDDTDSSLDFHNIKSEPLNSVSH